MACGEGREANDIAIDDRIAAAAVAFGIPPAFLQAMITTEGGPAGFLRAVQDMEPDIEAFDDALRFGCRAVAQRAFEYAMDPLARQTVIDGRLVQRNFLEYFASRWRDLRAAFDPEYLTEDWAKSMRACYAKVTGTFPGENGP